MRLAENWVRGVGHFRKKIRESESQLSADFLNLKGTQNQRE